MPGMMPQCDHSDEVRMQSFIDGMCPICIYVELVAARVALHAAGLNTDDLLAQEINKNRKKDHTCKSS